MSLARTGMMRAAMRNMIVPSKAAVGTRTSLTHIQPGPPRVRMPFHKKLVIMVGITAATMFIPVWVMAHVREYQEPHS